MPFKAVALALALSLAGVAAPAQESQIAAAIKAQLNAFTARDPGKAFTYASPMIRALFGNPQNFAAMVQQGYPMVWTPKSVQMLGLKPVGNELWQKVFITDMAGRGWMLNYQMIDTPKGWKINGVEVLPGNGVGA